MSCMLLPKTKILFINRMKWNGEMIKYSNELYWFCVELEKPGGGQLIVIFHISIVKIDQTVFVNVLSSMWVCTLWHLELFSRTRNRRRIKIITQRIQPPIKHLCELLRHKHSFSVSIPFMKNIEILFSPTININVWRWFNRGIEPCTIHSTAYCTIIRDHMSFVYVFCYCRLNFSA